MKIPRTPLLLLLLLPSLARADSIDDAEAKRRGISVDRLLLERVEAKNKDLQTKITQLQDQQKKQSDTYHARIDALQKQAAAVKSAASPQEAAAAQAKIAADQQKPDAVPSSLSVATAIRWHDIIPGMTLDEAKRALEPPPKPNYFSLRSDWRQKPASGEGQHWTCSYVRTDAKSKPMDPVAFADVTLVNGKVTDVKYDKDQRDHWLLDVELLSPTKIPPRSGASTPAQPLPSSGGSRP